MSENEQPTDSLEDLANRVIEDKDESKKDNLLLEFAKRLDRLEDEVGVRRNEPTELERLTNNQNALTTQAAKLRNRVDKLEDIKNVTRVESDISRLERILLGVDDEDSVTTRSGKRALVIARNFQMWSEDGAQGRTINSSRLKPLLETKLEADDDEIQTVQVQRAMKACADMAGDKMEYKDAPGKRGKVLIQTKEIYWDEAVLEEAVSD